MTSSYGDFMACCGRLVVVKDAVRLKENKTGVGVIWRATTKYRMSGSCEWNHVISACANTQLAPSSRVGDWPSPAMTPDYAPSSLIDKITSSSLK